MPHLEAEGGQNDQELPLAGTDLAGQFPNPLYLHARKIHVHQNTVLATICTHAGGQEDDHLEELIRGQMYLVKHEFLQAHQHFEKYF